MLQVSRLKPINIPIVIASAFAVIAGLAAAPGAPHAELLVAPDGVSQLDLDDDHTFIVRNPEPGKITAEIYRNGYFQNGLMFGNALFDSDDLRRVRLCPGCDNVVFLQVHDQSSTYAAITGVVLWFDWPGWRLTVLPLMRPYVTEPDGTGVSRLFDNTRDSAGNARQVEYHFVNGQAVRLPH